MSTPIGAATAGESGTPSGYDSIWGLFTDWCAVTGHPALPAEPDTVIAFLEDCPCAPATRRRRVAAIDHHHAAAGYAPPRRTVAISATPGRATQEITHPSQDTAAAVQAALRALPSHGWTQGMFGRRDRCLLVLSQLAGVSYTELALLTAGMVTVTDGAARINTAGGATVTLPDADSPVVCGPCAIGRWLRVLDVDITSPSHRVLARKIRDAAPVTDRSPHLCRSRRELSPLILDVPLLPPIDQWGYLPFPLQRLSPHSLSRLVHQMLAGDVGTHRHISLDDEVMEPGRPPAPAPERKVYTREDAQRAWARRRADLENMAGVDSLLAEIDARAKELEQRTAALLTQSTTHDPDQRST